MYKRVLSCLIMVLLLISTTAFASDYSNVSTNDLINQVAQLNAELFARTIAYDEKKTLYSSDGCSITFEDVSISYFGDLNVGLRIINNSEHTIDLVFNEADVNGWTVDLIGMNCQTQPDGKRKDAYICFSSIDEDADVTVLEQLETIQLRFWVQFIEPEDRTDYRYTDLIIVNCIYTPQDGLMVIPQ